MRRLLTMCAVGLFAGLVASLSVGAAGVPAGRWVVRDLGVGWSTETTDGSFDGAPNMAINARGQILGEAQTRYGLDYTFLWQNGKTIRLPFERGRDSSSDLGGFVGAPSLNDRGQVVGIVRRYGARGAVTSAAIWENGKVRRVGPADGALINSSGQVVAWSNEGPWFLWENGKVLARGRTAALDAFSQADRAIVAINGRGQIVGQALLGKPEHSWSWEDGKTTDLGVLPPPPGYPSRYKAGRFATDLNERGQVVGWGIPEEVFLWQDGKRLRIPPGGTWHGKSVLADNAVINDHGQVVGQEGIDWWLWEAGRLRVEDANGEYVAINNRGRVVGLADTYVDNPVKGAFLWENGRWTRLPLLPGDGGGGGVALNERNQIAGISCTFVQGPEGHGDSTWRCRYVLWSGRG